jgi:hypothetical protein
MCNTMGTCAAARTAAAARGGSYRAGQNRPGPGPILREGRGPPVVRDGDGAAADSTVATDAAAAAATAEAA